MTRTLLVILFCATALPGCAVHEMHKDQDLIRTTLLDLYTNQIMDNLVRASNGMPIIQLDYTNAGAQVTVTNTIAGSDAQATTASNLLAIPAATLSATRMIVTTLMGNTGSTSANQVTITANPLITSNDVYDAYLTYLNKPGSLMVTSEPPKPGCAHISKKFNGHYYWVPIENRKLFFDLSLATTSQRGATTTQTSDPFFKVTLNDPGGNVEHSKEIDPIGTGKVLTFRIGKQKIPIDDGSLILDSDKSSYKFDVETVLLADPNAQADPADLENPSEAKYIKVRVYNDEIDLRFNKDGTQELPVGKSLFYVSLKDQKLSLYTTDTDGKPFKQIREDDTSLTDKNREAFKKLHERIEKDKLWENPALPKQKREIILKIATICGYDLNPKLDLFKNPPLTGKLYLRHSVPAPPVNQNQNDRTNFLLQGILFNQNRM